MNEPQLEIINWGLIPYAEALKNQESLVEEIARDQKPGVIILCTHPPVVTTGRKTQAGDLTDWHGETVEISRGGRATYHGPSQLVIYPLINLKFARKSRKPQEVEGYLRTLESSLVKTVNELGIQAQGKLQSQSSDNRDLEATGVWVESKKLVSIGIAVRKWVTFHGAAMNIDFDPMAFKGLSPCGYNAQTMISLEEIRKQKIDRKKIEALIAENLQRDL